MRIAAAVTFCLATGLAAAEGADEARFVFVYEARTVAVPEDAQRVRMWIPLPIATADQEVGTVTVTASEGAGFSVQAFGGGNGRVLYAESTGEPVVLRYEAEIVRRAVVGGRASDAIAPEQALRPDALIPLDGKVAAIARQLDLADDPVAAARALYDHTLARMRYDKPAGQPWGAGDAEWACESGFGNCTDFHSYFIGLARARGIPARFVMGFPVPDASAGAEAPISGYHCWAWFWGGQGTGWIPVDISEADKQPEKAAFYFGHLDPWRVALVHGRDHELVPAPEAGRLNLFVYPHVEVDGRAHAQVEKRFARRLAERPAAQD